MLGDKKCTDKRNSGHPQEQHQMKLRKRCRTIDDPIFEPVRPVSTGESHNQQMDSPNSGMSSNENNFEEDTSQMPACKRSKANNIDSPCIRPENSEEKLYDLSKSQAGHREEEGVIKTVEVGSRPVGEAVIDETLTSMKMPNNLQNDRRELQSVMHSITLINSDKGNVTYKCKLCGVVFLDYFDIYIHIRMHGGERSMRALVSQQKTMIVNTPDRVTRLRGRPYECLICSRKFKLPKSLLVHVMNIHPTSEDTMIARVPQTLLPAGWVGYDSKVEEQPLPPDNNCPDPSLPTTHQSLKAMRMLVETDAALVPAVGGSKFLKPSHTLAGVLAPPPSSMMYRHPIPVSQDFSGIHRPLPRNSQASGNAVPREATTVKYTSSEIPLDLSSSPDTQKKRSSGSPISPMNGFLESPNSKHDSNAHSPDIRVISCSPSKSSMSSSGEYMVPRQSMAGHRGLQDLQHQRFPSKSQSLDRDIIAEYYQQNSQHRSSIQDPKVSSDTHDTVDVKADTMNLDQNSYLQKELERQFKIELNFAELRLRRKYSDMGLCNERMKGRRGLQEIDSMSTREIDLHLIDELMRVREMQSSDFEDDLDSDEEGLYPYPPQAPMVRHLRRESFPAQSRIHVPAPHQDRHDSWPRASIYPGPAPPMPKAPVWTEKGANRQPPIRKPLRQPIIPHLLSLPSRF